MTTELADMAATGGTGDPGIEPPVRDYFPIRVVSQRTGVNTVTLRAWERRYEVVRPNRDGSGRRTYSASDVARLRLLRTATELGHTISRLAQLSDDDLAKLVNDSGGHARIGNARGQWGASRDGRRIYPAFCRRQSRRRPRCVVVLGSVCQLLRNVAEFRTELAGSQWNAFPVQNSYWDFVFIQWHSPVSV